MTIIGVTIIVSDGLEGGTYLGDFAALVASIFLALSLVKCRQSGKDLSLSGCLGGMISMLFALPLMVLTFAVPTYPAWLALNVLIMVPLSGFTLQLAPRFIPAASSFDLFPSGSCFNPRLDLADLSRNSKRPNADRGNHCASSNHRPYIFSIAKF